MDYQKYISIVCDNWKLPTYKKHLFLAGYTYEIVGSLTPEATAIQVFYDGSADQQIKLYNFCRRVELMLKANQN